EDLVMAQGEPCRLDTFRPNEAEAEIAKVIVIGGGDGKFHWHWRYCRFLSILSQISFAISGPPRFLIARMPVGDVTLISVMKSPITSMPTNMSPRSRSAGPSRSHISASRLVSSVALGEPPRTMLERKSSAAGTRLTAPA